MTSEVQHSKLHLFLSLLFIGASVVCFGQSKFHHFSIGADVKTNGFGVSSQINIGETKANIRNGIGLSITGLRHGKETKVQNENYTNPKPYVFGKLNNVFTVNPVYTIEKFIGKSSGNHPAFYVGVEAGPSLAFKRPYYIYSQDMDNVQEFKPVKEPYNPAEHMQQDDILAGAGLLNGFDEMNMQVGIVANVVLQAEWEQAYYLQRFKSFVQFAYYPGSLDIMHNVDSQLFASLGFAYQIGSHH